MNSELEANPRLMELVKHYRILVILLFYRYRLSSISYIECLNKHSVIIILFYDNQEVYKLGRTMAPVSLPCVLGAEVCSFKTIELEFENSNTLLVEHGKLAHRGGGACLQMSRETNQRSFLAHHWKQTLRQRLGRTLQRLGHSIKKNITLRVNDSFASYTLVAPQTSRPACPGSHVASSLNKRRRI